MQLSTLTARVIKKLELLSVIASSNFYASFMSSKLLAYAMEHAIRSNRLLIVTQKLSTVTTFRHDQKKINNRSNNGINNYKAWPEKRMSTLKLGNALEQKISWKLSRKVITCKNYVGGWLNISVDIFILSSCRHIFFFFHLRRNLSRFYNLMSSVRSILQLNVIGIDWAILN